MKKYKIKTCASIIKDARELKNMTISELCLEIKDRRINEKTIKQWESSKAYPDLDMCYKLAYILEINPNELLWLRNYERKKFKVKK